MMAVGRSTFTASSKVFGMSSGGGCVKGSWLESTFCSRPCRQSVVSSREGTGRAVPPVLWDPGVVLPYLNQQAELVEHPYPAVGLLRGHAAFHHGHDNQVGNAQGGLAKERTRVCHRSQHSSALSIPPNPL